ncbi:ABC transporter permease [Conexibacter sp. CPCC 206217]|uniref:ABC transporter permease n=1 Tax=Conexibacter sp. CPCC 206217 TaxID=3064574 RepID=UPI002718471C|nr:ABC transporter permease [Conexibacter sp. CPCC 206217]MDO8210172.1 ABC transporter permease [Conexibacter sp. CPCC 206217]
MTAPADPVAPAEAGVGTMKPPRSAAAEGRSARRSVARGWGLMCLIAFVGIVLVALVGPFLAPHPITEVLGAPYSPPSGPAPLGTDYLGRDVLSRFLSGGRLLIAVSLGSTLLAYVVAAPIGMLMGYVRGLPDRIAGGAVNVLLSIPPVVLALLIVAGLGTSPLVAGLAVTIVLIAPIVRIVRGATAEIVTSEYIEAAVMRGETGARVIFHEVLPNIRPTLVADFGVRLAYTVILYASLNFLGLGQAPPAADWGLMVSENRGGLLVMPWAVVVPALAIAGLTVAGTGVAEAVSRSLGRSQGNA